MTYSRKITYSAVSSALATICIMATRFLPLSFFPLTISSVCYFVAFSCGIVFGILSISVSFFLSFFWGSFDYLILILASFFAIYSFAAFLMKNLNYSNSIQSVIRLITVILLFNILFALVVFGFLELIGDFLFGFNLVNILHNPFGYVSAAAVGSIIAAGFDILFVMATNILIKKIKLDKNNKK